LAAGDLGFETRDFSWAGAAGGGTAAAAFGARAGAGGRAAGVEGLDTGAGFPAGAEAGATAAGLTTAFAGTLAAAAAAAGFATGAGAGDLRFEICDFKCAVFDGGATGCFFAAAGALAGAGLPCFDAVGFGAAFFTGRVAAFLAGRRAVAALLGDVFRAGWLRRLATMTEGSLTDQ
jgi:hypothetical protein